MTMNNEQEFTPKYWVVHDKEDDDILISTASKAKDNACSKMKQIFGDRCFEDGRYSVDLVEIKLCDLE